MTTVPCETCEEVTEQVTQEQVRQALKTVIDPELGINIVDLNLIKQIDIEGSSVKIKMTLTSPFCPLSKFLVDNARRVVEVLDGVEKVDIQLVW